MYTVGLNCGHNSTICLLRNSQIVSCVGEERFTRVKNQVGFPTHAYRWTLTNASIGPDQIGRVIIATLDPFSHQLNLSNNPPANSPNYPINKQTHSKAFFARLSADFISNQKKRKLSQELKTTHAKVVQQYSKLLAIKSSRIAFADHHLLHAYSTIANLPKPPWLIFTLDAEGDGLCASVNIFNGQKIKVISKTSNPNSLGYLYLAFTKFLNLKPNEHEYKVMGLAPYADPIRTQPVVDDIEKILKITNTKPPRFKSLFPLPNLDITLNYLEQNFRGKGYRFDTIASALQQVTQNYITTWIDYFCNKYGVSQIALSGGVFMNVKANQKISQLKSVRKLFVMPSAGDESLAIGAAFFGYHQTAKKIPGKLSHLYLGPSFNQQVPNLAKKLSKSKKYKVTKKQNIEKAVSKLLASGQTIARFSGKMEWGARALGNRSILARPDDLSIIKQLNSAIKKRDFWMPFAPSILSSDIHRYIINPKKIKAPYMNIAFDTTPLGKQHLKAAMHQYDETVRPQEVFKSHNPAYFELISHFKSITGIGAVLNTSFNLHGHPIVCTPQDALDVFDNSGLNYLALDDYLIKKKQ